MKRTILSILTVITGFGFANAQDPTPNASFENWETITSGLNDYSEPIDWNTANECASLLGIESVSQSSDAHSGSSSALLTSMQGTGNILINGVLTTSSMICDPFNPGITGGTTYTSRPDSVVGWFKYAPVDVDTAYVQVILFNQEDTVAYLKHQTWETTSEWTRFSAPLDYWSSDTPDKISVFFNSSWGNGNLGEGFAGSALYIDDVDIISNPTGINDVLASAAWNIYPNPVIGELNISMPAGGEANIEILDVTGKRVKLERINESNTKLMVDQLVAGIYLYQISSVDDVVIKTGKLLVNP